MQLIDFLGLYHGDAKICLVDTRKEIVFTGDIFDAMISEYRYSKVFSFSFHNAMLFIKVEKIYD